MGNPRDKQIADALRLADKNKPRNREIIEPFTYGEYGEFRGRDVGKWRTEQGKRGREKSYDPWKDQSNIYTHPSEQRHVPEDPAFYISPEEYREGTQGKGIYALARGGRAGMAVGGNPAVTTTPPIDPTAAATPSVPLITPTTNIGTGAPTVTPTVAPVAQPAVSALPDPYQAYVSSLYQNILGRPAEQSGQQYWVDQLASGQMSEGDILQQFAGSQEFQNLYATDPSKAIGALYQEALGRTPEQSGLSYWQQQAQQGLALPTMVQNFLQSQEGQGVSNISRMYQDYTGTIPTNEQLAQAGQMLASGKSMADVEQAISNSPESNQYYVNQIYQDLLGRAPDAEGANYWTQQLTSGQITPEDFYNTVQNSNEASSFENSSFIKDEYRGLFGREPTQQELNDALGQLKSGQTDYSKLDSSLSNTDEAKQYAASNFDPYQVAGATVTTNQPRTAYQYSKATDDLVRSLPKEQQMGALLQQEGGMWIEKILNPNTPQEIKDQAMRQLEGIANVVANRAALGLTENNGKKGSPWAGWFNNNDKNSITSQILAPSAFSAMKIGVGKLAKEGYNAIVNNALPNFDNPAYQPIKDMISGVLNNTRPDITNGATHYKANYVHPNWAGGKRGLPFRTDLGGAPGGRGPYHQYYGSSANAQLAKEKRFGSGNVQFAGVTPQSSGVPTDPFIGQQLAQSGAGGNVAGGGMFNPGGGAIGAPADATSGIGSTAGFPTWTPQSTGSLPAVSQVPVNYTQIGTFDPYTSQQTSMGWDPMTGIGLQSPLYAGPGQYINPGFSPTATNFSGTLAFGPGFKHGGAVDDALRIARATGGGAWTRKEGKNPKGGLNEKGRASLRAQGHDIKRPQPEGGSRKDSFCARMKGMKAKLTSAETANDPNSRINKSLRVWNCHSAGGAVDNALKIAKYPERKKKDWMISHNYEDRGGEMKKMSPDEFLDRTRPLKGTDQERRSINALKGAMERGDHFDPLQLLANGLEDGRHRATAAKELGIKKVPVIDFRNKRADGGPIDDRAHEFEREQLDTGEPQVKQYNPEAGKETMKEALRIAAGMTTPGAIADVAGYLGGPSTLENIRNKNYGDAALQIAGIIPGVGPLSKAAKIAEEARAVEKVGVPIRAYHGTPHKFDKFDISKIGTGEGAQMYGHGLYFAGNEDVAKGYRDNLVKSLPTQSEDGWIAHVLGSANGDKDKASRIAQMYSREAYTDEASDQWRRVAQRLQQEDIGSLPKGHMYEVDIHADPSHMLDWDKPLSEQSDIVKSVLNQFGLNTNPQRVWNVKETAKGGKFTVYDHWGQPQGTFADRAKAEEKARQRTLDADAHGGMYAYTQLGGNTAFSGLDKGVASNKLREAGIPGIQYLDAGSRRAGEGSRNYVVFDPDIVEILRRYAKGGEVWDKPRPKSLGKPDPLTSKEKSKAKRMAKAAGRPYPNLVDNMRAARADGGELEADVSYAPDLPLMAQRDPNAEIADAMRVASEDRPVKYDTGPVEGEATLKPYEPTLKEKIYQKLAGTEQRPSPERAQFSRGVSELAEFTPGLGNVMAAQEAARRGDTKGVIMAALPIPGAATEARMAKAAVSESGGLNNWLSKKYPNVDFSVSEPRAGHITVNKIVVPKELRNKGIGTQFMQDVAAYADASGKPLALSPSADFGGSKQRLTEWYKSLGFVPNKGRSQDFTISESMVRRPKQVAESYQGSHKSPGPENGAPLWRMHQIYPDDLYSSQGFRYYADFGQPYDREGYYHATRFIHSPNASVTIYRAVPKDADIKNINKGDWVTLTKDYAKDHGESALQGDYKILQKQVKARDLFTHGDSIHEFGYHPQPMMKDDEFVSKLTPNEAKEKLSRISGSARQSLRKALEARSVQERRYGGAVQNALRIAKGR